VCPSACDKLCTAACLESIISSSHRKERSLSLKDKFRLSVQQTSRVIGHPRMTALNCRAMFAAFISQSNSVGVCEWRMVSYIWPSSWCERGSRPRSPQKHRGIFTEQKKIIRSCLLIKLEASPVLPQEQSSAIHHRFLQVWMQELLQSSGSPSCSESLSVDSNNDTVALRNLD